MAGIKKSTAVQKLEYDTIDRFLPDRVNRNDPRYLEAAKFYDETHHGTHVIKLYKTTRAGASVSLSAESINRKELLTLICRTNRVITHTIKGDVVDHTQKYQANPVHITRNSFCPRITKLIKKHPSVELLGILPLPNCDKCKIPAKDCPIKYAFDTPAENVDVYCLTYAKLANLILSESGKVKQLLSKVLSSRNFILDEVQYLQEGEAVGTPIWIKTKDREFALIKGFKERFHKVSTISMIMKCFISEANEFLRNLQPLVEKLKIKSKENRHLKHLSISSQTPSQKKEQELFDALITEKASKEEANYRGDLLRNTMKNASESILPEAAKIEKLQTNSHIDHTTPFQVIMSIQETLVHIMTKREKYDINEDDIVALSKLLFIMNSRKFTVSYVKSLHGETITLQAENGLFYDTLKKFIEKILALKQSKRVIFTTATFGTLKLENLFHTALKKIPVESQTWGSNGDPMNNCEKALIITDKFRLSPYNFGRKVSKITKLIQGVVGRYGLSNVQICTMNKTWAARLLKELKPKGFTKDDITWYGSDRTEGVASKKRIWIMIGLAEKPVNAKDPLAEVQAPFHHNPLEAEGEELFHFISQKLRRESVQIATYQAFSRAKDPEGKDRSVVIAVGATKKEVDDCLLWGPDRQLVPEKSEKGIKFNVVVERSLSKPKTTIAPLTTGIEESLHIIDQWMSYGKIVEYKLNWAHLKKMADARGYVSVKRITKIYGFDEKKVREFFAELPEFFSSQGITDYVLVHDSAGAIKAVATKEYYEKQGKPRIIYNNRFSLIPIVQADWFISLKGAVERAPKDFKVLPPSYFNHHVSSNIYTHLSEFFDVLTSNPHLCPGWIVVGEKSKKRETRKLIRDIHCLSSWAPNFPRRFGSPIQLWVNNYSDLTQSITNSLDAGLDAFISVYSFPEHHHPMEGGNPPVSTVFIDLDIESPELSDLRRRWGNGDKSVIDQLLSLRTTLLNKVLKQAKVLVGYLVRQNIQPRILLSGFKGVHIFIDFPSVQFSSSIVAKSIITKFLDEVNTCVAQSIGVHVNCDTSVIGDLSRLCRVPNTVNFKATKLLGRPQYAVPITIDEFLKLTPEGYDKLCTNPHHISVARNESNEVLVTLTRITEDIDLDEVAVTPKTSVKDPERLEKYERECTKEILTDEDFEKLDIRPCFKKVRRERISLDGSGGHKMRIGAVMELAAKELSIPSIVRWFDFCSDYDPDITEASVKSIISRGYTDRHVNEYGREYRKGLRCTTIQRCGFCLGVSCNIYRRKNYGRKQR
jgi:hypothetical protein